MTVQGCIHWVGLGGLTHLQPGPANQNEFVPTKRHYYMQILVSLPPSVATNSLKGCSRHLMVEKLRVNYLATALVDIAAVIMPIAHSLKT